MATTAQAYVAEKAKSKLQKQEIKLDPLKPDQAQIKVEYCGLCHSDVSVIDNAWGISKYPCVGGHEIVGKISKVGDKVKKLDVGQTVGAGWHSGFCQSCEQCDTGDFNLCPNATMTIVGHYGGFANVVHADEKAVVAIPEGIEKKVAGPLFCAGITVFNPIVQAGLSPLSRVAVIGIGGLGHLALQFLNAWGCHVTAFTSKDDKKEEALRLGAHEALNSKKKEEIESVKKKFDFLLVTVNVKLDWDLFISTLKPKGKLHFVGAVLEPLDVTLFPMLMSQLSISGSLVGSPPLIDRMLKFAALHDIKPWVEEYKIEDINNAIDHLKNGKPRYRIVLKH